MVGAFCSMTWTFGFSIEITWFTGIVSLVALIWGVDTCANFWLYVFIVSGSLTSTFNYDLAGYFLISLTFYTVFT